MSRKIILIKQELLLLVYELNRSGLLAENEKIRPILAQLEIGRAVQQECRDRARMPSSACKKKRAPIHGFGTFGRHGLQRRDQPGLVKPRPGLEKAPAGLIELG